MRPEVFVELARARAEEAAKSLPERDRELYVEYAVLIAADGYKAGREFERRSQRFHTTYEDLS